MLDRGRGGLECIPLAAVGREECKSNIRIFQVVPFQQSAQSEGCAGIAQLDQVQAIAVLAVADNGPVLDVAPGVVECSNLPVADVADEVWLIEQGEYEGGIVPGQMPQPQAR